MEQAAAPQPHAEPPEIAALVERPQRQTHATDRQIDKLVYVLYGLSEEEIRIVEGEG